MSDRVSITGEILEITDPDDIGLITDVMRVLREKAAERQAEQEAEDSDLPDLTRPMNDLWVAVSVEPDGSQRIMCTPQGMPMISPSEEITPEVRRLLAQMDPRGHRFELRRYHLAETEDVTPEASGD